VQFIDQYSQIESVKIDFVDKETALLNDKKSKVLRDQKMMKQLSVEQSGSDSEEFKTPEGSSEDEQGHASPITKSPVMSSQEQRFQKRQQMILDGKLATFEDFEFLEVIGEGSFGRVFKCKHKNNG